MGRAVRWRHSGSFSLQDEVTSRIANALDAELIAAEAARPTENPDALDYILRGRAASLKPNSRDGDHEIISWWLQPRSHVQRSWSIEPWPHRPAAGTRILSKAKLRMQHRLEEAILEFETSLSVNRNSVWSLHHLALCKLLTGSIEEVIPL